MATRVNLVLDECVSSTFNVDGIEILVGNNYVQPPPSYTDFSSSLCLLFICFCFSLYFFVIFLSFLFRISINYLELLRHSSSLDDGEKQEMKFLAKMVSDQEEDEEASTHFQLPHQTKAKCKAR